MTINLVHHLSTDLLRPDELGVIHTIFGFRAVRPELKRQGGGGWGLEEVKARIIEDVFVVESLRKGDLSCKRKNLMIVKKTN